MKRLNADMSEGPLFFAIISYTIPIILTSILQLLFNAADLIVVGRFCGSSSVAAVGATGSLTNLLANFFIGLSVGSSVTIAQAYGARDNEAQHRTLHTAVSISLLAGSILTVIGVLFSETFLTLMGTPAEILPKSAIYMKIYFGGIIFNMLYNYCASILRAVGDTVRPLMFLSLAGVINVILNIVFVTVFHMDVAGVALATTISQGISAILVIASLMHRTDACRLYIREIRIYAEQLKKILVIGLPAGIQSILFSISNVIIQSSINSFEEVFMSGSAAAASIEGFVYVTLNAFMQTSVNFTGQNYGAKNYKRIKQGFFMCLACVLAVGIPVCIAVRLLGPKLLSIYITDSAEAIQYGLVRMNYICLPYALCGLMEVTTGAIRGVGKSFVAMFMSIIGVVGIRIVWIYTVFVAYHTPETLFVSYPISWIGTFVCQFIAFMIIYNKKIKNANKGKIQS